METISQDVPVQRLPRHILPAPARGTGWGSTWPPNLVNGPAQAPKLLPAADISGSQQEPHLVSRHLQSDSKATRTPSKPLAMGEHLAGFPSIQAAKHFQPPPTETRTAINQYAAFVEGSNYGQASQRQLPGSGSLQPPPPTTPAGRQEAFREHVPWPNPKPPTISPVFQQLPPRVLRTPNRLFAPQSLIDYNKGTSLYLAEWRTFELKSSDIFSALEGIGPPHEIIKDLFIYDYRRWRKVSPEEYRSHLYHHCHWMTSFRVTWKAMWIDVNVLQNEGALIHTFWCKRCCVP